MQERKSTPLKTHLISESSDRVTSLNHIFLAGGLKVKKVEEKATFNLDHNIEVMDLFTNKVIAKLIHPGTLIDIINLPHYSSPQCFASASKEGFIIWQHSNGKINPIKFDLKLLRNEDECFVEVSALPDSSCLAGGIKTKTGIEFFLYEIDTQKLLRKNEPVVGENIYALSRNCFAISRKGDGDKTACKVYQVTWEVKDKMSFQDLRFTHGTDLTGSPDGKFCLLHVITKYKIYDSYTICSLSDEGLKGPVNALAFQEHKSFFSKPFFLADSSLVYLTLDGMAFRGEYIDGEMKQTPLLDPFDPRIKGLHPMLDQSLFACSNSENLDFYEFVRFIPLNLPKEEKKEEEDSRNILMPALSSFVSRDTAGIVCNYLLFKPADLFDSRESRIPTQQLFELKNIVRQIKHEIAVDGKNSVVKSRQLKMIQDFLVDLRSNPTASLKDCFKKCKQKYPAECNIIEKWFKGLLKLDKQKKFNSLRI